MVDIVDETSFRSGREIIKQSRPEEYGTITRLLTGNKFDIDTQSPEEGQRDISGQVTEQFESNGWKTEVRVKNMSGPKYDLYRNDVPIEVELGHKRMVYADFFKFLADYSERNIPAGVMIVTENAEDFGRSWHNSRNSTLQKLSAIEDNYFVPLWIIGIEP
jgi:hypothetical protein